MLCTMNHGEHTQQGGEYTPPQNHGLRVYIYNNQITSVYICVDYLYLQVILQFIGYERNKYLILLRSLCKWVFYFLLTTKGNIDFHFGILFYFLLICVTISTKLLFAEIYSCYGLL